jgi:hypothetical protein
LAFAGIYSCDTAKYHDYPFPEHDKKIVVNAMLTANEPIYLRISETKAVFDQGTSNQINRKRFEPVYPEKVFLYEDGILVEELEAIDPEIRSPFYNDYLNYVAKNTIPVPGKEYTISVEDENNTLVSGTCVIPNAPEFRMISYDTLIIDEPEFLSEYLKVSFELKKSVDKQYYIFRCREVEYRGIDEDNVDFRIDDVVLGQFFSKYDNVIFRSEDLLTSKHNFDILIDFSTLKPWETMLYFELLSITEEAYTYFSQCYQIHNLDPRISEPVKVISNIDNGLGIVIGANIASDSIINGPPFDPYEYE